MDGNKKELNSLNKSILAATLIAGLGFGYLAGALLGFPASRNNQVYIGDIIQFGQFDWRVLEIRADGTALIITEDVIEMNLFNDSQEAVSWEYSYIRYYLNTTFLNSFTPSERERISPQTQHSSSRSNVGSIFYDRNPRWIHSEYVFLLSVEEVVAFFDNDISTANRGAGFMFPLSYIVVDREIDDDITVTDKVSRRVGQEQWWWLRTTNLKGSPAYVNANGTISLSSAQRSSNSIGGIRPALWITLD